MEQVAHKIRNKSEINPCNLILFMVDSFCHCGKTVSELLLEDISSEVEIEYRSSEENDQLLDNNEDCHT